MTHRERGMAKAGTRVGLWVRGFEESPEIVASRLGGQPEKRFQKGKPGPQGKGYKDNACGWYAYPTPNTTGIDDLVNAVLARVDQEQLHSMSK